MRLDHFVAIAAEHYVGRKLRRVLLAVLGSAFTIVAVYFFTVAGMLALEAQYGALQARLIVAAIYSALAATAFVIGWATGRTRGSAGAPMLGHSHEMQLIMLVEAAMLGYALARKGDRLR